MHSFSLIIADDHPVVLQGLIALLGEHEDFKLIATCSGGAACIEAIRNSTPDIALVDINMPDANGFQVLKAVTPERLSTRIVFLAASPTNREMITPIAVGSFRTLRQASPPKAFYPS